MGNLLYSSRQVRRDADITEYTRELEQYVLQQKYEALMLKMTQKERFGIRSYPETEQDYHDLTTNI